MKKFLAMLLAAVMVLSMAACGETTPAETTAAATEAAAETAAPVARENKVILGDTTELTGDFTGGLVTNGASDMMINDLVNDYGTMVTNQGGNYVENPTVMKSWERTDNDDGTATYTITINEGLVYNNGDPITAKDYAFKTMITCTPFASALSFVSSSQDKLVGGKAAYTGESPVLTGLRLIDDYTVAVTIVEEYANYYYADTYAAMDPWNAEFWLGEGYSVADDGEGVYMTLNGEQIVLQGGGDAEKTFRAAMTGTNGFVSAGPYSLTKYDPATTQATLDINPNYAGNFEGQKPSIQTLVVVRAQDATWADQLKTGGMNIYAGITDGDDINTLLDMIDNGEEFTAIKYDRAGYGKLQFLCDVGPTQFVEVRHAIAQLLNRDEFTNTFCQGFGSVVDAPYATSMQMYMDSKDYLADNLSSYAYNVDAANKELTDNGWNLNAKGEEWKEGDGLRHKDVTNEKINDKPVNFDGCIDVAGKKLMPLEIKWYSTEGNPVSDLLAIMLANSDAVAQAGMKITQHVGDWDGLLGALYHQDPDGNKIPPEYGMVNLATGWTSALYDYSFNWTDDPEKVALGYNGSYLYDMGEGGLDDLSMRMVYDVKAGDYDAYLDLWQQYIVRWNQQLPEIPLYCNVYVTAVPSWVEGYEQNSFWGFQKAILYASIPSAQ